jgi:hypothetical protein
MNSVSFQFEKKVVERGTNGKKYLEAMDYFAIPLQALNTVNQGGRCIFSAKPKSSLGAKNYTACHSVCVCVCVETMCDLSSQNPEYSTVKTLISSSDSTVLYS